MKKKAFTLIELLVVIAIIALLVSILLPSLNRARDLAKKAACASNLNSIGKATFLYANSYEGRLPSFDDCNDWVLASGYNWDKVTDPDSNATRSSGTTRAWFLLVRDDTLAVQAFRCPADKTVAHGNYATDDHYDFDPRPKFGGRPLSFSMQVTKTNKGEGVKFSLSQSANLALGADSNGLVTWSTLNGDQAWLTNRDTSVALDEGNSPNHGQEGQNVLFLSGSVGWHKDTMCGVDDDNIYTKANGTDNGASPDTGGLPASKEDSYLRP